MGTNAVAGIPLRSQARPLTTGTITAHVKGYRMAILRIDHETWTEPRTVFVIDLEEVNE